VGVRDRTPTWCAGRACLAALLVVLVASPATARQINTAEITGVVKDHLGGVLPGAAVIAAHPASGTKVERVTDPEGRFFLPQLRIGTWDVRITFAGFQGRALQVTLEVGRTQHLEVTLAVEGLSAEVAVSAAAPLLQTTTAEISDVINNQEVVQIPLSGRNFLSSSRRVARVGRPSSRPVRFRTSADSGRGTTSTCSMARR
jgi:hypothetical protein